MSLDDPNDFGELRSLMHRPASRAAWARLCTLVDSRSPHMLEGVVRYADELLATWPAHYRVAPGHWVVRVCTLRDGEDFLPWHLVRALDLDHDLFSTLSASHILERTAHITQLRLDGRHHRAAHLVTSLCTRERPFQALHIHHWSASPSRLTRQLAETSMPALRTLHISHSRQDHDAIDALLDAPWLSGVERLELPHNVLQDATILELLDRMPQLTHLDLSSNNLSIEGMRALLHARRSPPLQTLILHHNAPSSSASTQSLFRTPVQGLRSVSEHSLSPDVSDRITVADHERSD